MTATDLQMTFDDIAVDSEIARQRPYRPTLGVESGQEKMVACSELGLRSSPHVHRTSNWFNVFRVDTKSYPTQMIGLQAFGPWAYSLYPDCAMSNGLLATKANLPIAFFPNCGSCPNPARSRKSTILNSEVPFIYKASSYWHIATSYYTLRVAFEGYEETFSS